MTTITAYSELSSLARVVYTQFKKGTFLADDVDKLLNAGKITQDEINFIKS